LKASILSETDDLRRSTVGFFRNRIFFHYTLSFNGYARSCTWAYKKTPLFFEKRGIGQPTMILLARECGFESIQRRFVFEFMLSEFSFQIRHSHKKTKKA
jgi:hypothetical protein